MQQHEEQREQQKQEQEQQWEQRQRQQVKKSWPPAPGQVDSRVRLRVSALFDDCPAGCGGWTLWPSSHVPIWEGTCRPLCLQLTLSAELEPCARSRGSGKRCIG